MATIDTSSVKSYVQPIANAPVVASVSSYIGSWWNGGEQQPQQSLSASGGGMAAPASQKEESADWSNWGWGAESKEKEEPAAASNGGGADAWGSWNDDDQTAAAKPRRVGKKD
jgi:hypothetical protein